MSNVKAFLGQRDKQTTKNYMLPIYQCGGRKNFNTIITCVSDNIEVAFLKTVNKEDFYKFYTVSCI